LGGPFGVVVDLVNNELVVANLGTPSITVYTRTADGNTAPLRTLSGALTALSSPRLLAVTTTATVEARLTNLSTRAQVGLGPDQVIAGVIIEGSAPMLVLLRALGPSLTALGVPGALANPILQLFSGQTLLAQNDDWQTQADPTCAATGHTCGDAAAITATALAPPHPQDAALLITLPPGTYTVIVSGAGGLTGVGLVEVYEVP
jgi:hypothetical protein